MEKIRAKITSFLVFIFSMIITFPSHAEKILNQPFAYGTPEKLVYDLKDFFREIEAEVLRVEGDLVTIGAGRKNGINKYMRFDIVSSKKIKHPVTGEE
ncbi:MAG: hypothetical protein N2257_10800, partial [Thermodesulfovibrionales bacterium]|nr:hypothetical protein [Thermodesulfovibrionales bacterium]